MQHVKWVKPALLWDGEPFQSIAGEPPTLLKVGSDNFVPEFLDAMGAAPTRQNGTYVQKTATSFLKDHRVAETGSVPKLWQPFHGVFYLVVASLVCRTAGLPDKTVNRKNGEKVAFVVRRVNGKGDKWFWSEDQGWSPVNDEADLTTEERFPMQPVSVLTGYRPDHTLFPHKRSIYFGYVVTANRNKYLTTRTPEMAYLDAPDKTPAEKIDQYFSSIKQDDGTVINHRIHEFNMRVVNPWNWLIGKPLLSVAENHAASTSIVIDFGDFLKRALPKVWKRITNNADLSQTDYPEQYVLYETLTQTELRDAGVWKSFVDVLKVLADKIDADIAHGGGDEDWPENAAYDLRMLRSVIPAPHEGDPPTVTTINLNCFLESYLSRGMDCSATTPLRSIVKDALDEYASLPQSKTTDDPQINTMLTLIKKLAIPMAAAANGNGQQTDYRYVIHLIYEYDPECPPVFSPPSLEFDFAAHFDPDAPPRFVRIEMPSVRPRDLRKYSHGVGVQMRKELNDVIKRIDPEQILNGGGLLEPVGAGVDMLCTFSIPIVTLVALIVMFIFLIMLNIIFWWLALVRICLPIPRFD